MSYTAGLADAIDRERASIAAALARIVTDAEQKMDDPDRFDRTYVLEDLIRHTKDIMCSLDPHKHMPGFGALAYEVGEGEPETGAVEDGATVPLPDLTEDADEEAFEAVNGPAEKGKARGTFPMPIDPAMAEAIRQTHNLMEFAGVQRHPFEAAHSPQACTRMVMRDGYGDACGFGPEHTIHDYREATR